MQLLIFVLRAVTTAAGGVLCYAALFLYETEEEAIQNTLEAWWISIDDVARVAVSRHEAFVRTAAILANTMLTKLFGRRLISMRAVGASACLSLCSLTVIVAIIVGHGGLMSRLGDSADDWFVAAVVVMPAVTSESIAPPLILAAALAAVLIVSTGRSRLRWLPACAAVSALVALATLNIMYDSSQRFLLLGLLLYSCALGVMTDFGALVVLRRLFEWQSGRPRASSIYMAAVAEIAVGTGAVVLPGLIAAVFGALHVSYLPNATIMSVATNLFIMLLGFGFAGSALLLLLHRVIWPLVERPLYRVGRLGIFKSASNRAILGTLGTAMAGVGICDAGAVWSILARLLSSA
jgi:hypothetical protein